MNLTLKRHYKLILLFFAIIISILVFLSNTMIIAYTTGNNIDPTTENAIENDIYLFDNSVFHEIEVNISWDDYTSLIQTYEETSLKEYFKTDIIIDGVLVEDVGIRLKGQLTLQQTFGGFSEIEKMQLPFLVKFDEYVERQSYQGITELAIRIGSSEALLEEPLALYAYEIGGATVPESAYASVKVSDLNSKYYVICQNIEESYLAKNFNDSEGILYKAGNFVDLTYKGDDQTEYMEDFEQKTQINENDFAQLIEFLEFINKSTDKEFEEELDEWVYVNSLITMMVMEDLTENSDSFSGMNSNYYFYYSSIEKKFIMLPWDLNLAFGAMMGQGDMQKGGEFENILGGINRTEFEQARNFAGMAIQNFNQENFQRVKRENMPEGGVGRNGNNVLKERFFASEKFSQMYEEKYIEISDAVYCNNLLLEKLETISEAFTNYNVENNLLNQESYDKAVQEMKNYIEEQMEKNC